MWSSSGFQHLTHTGIPDKFTQFMLHKVFFVRKQKKKVLNCVTYLFFYSLSSLDLILQVLYLWGFLSNGKTCKFQVNCSFVSSTTWELVFIRFKETFCCISNFCHPNVYMSHYHIICLWMWIIKALGIASLVLVFWLMGFFCWSAKIDTISKWAYLIALGKRS